MPPCGDTGVTGQHYAQGATLQLPVQPPKPTVQLPSMADTVWRNVFERLDPAKGCTLAATCRRFRNIRAIPLDFCQYDPRRSGAVPLSTLVSLQNVRRFVVVGAEIMEADQEKLNQMGHRLPHLRRLRIRHSAFKSTQGLEPLKNQLEDLYFSNATNLMDISLLSHCPKLQTLKISWCRALRTAGPFDQLKSLHTLDLYHCNQLLAAPVCGPHLIKLSLANCTVLQDLSPLRGAVNLQVLDLNWCEHLQDLSPVATSCLDLRWINLKHCSSLRDVSPLANLPRLQECSLAQCRMIRDINPLAGCRSLSVLRLFACDGIRDISPLLRLSLLRELDISYCMNESTSPVVKQAWEAVLLQLKRRSFDMGVDLKVLDEVYAA